jgi:ribonuclease-3
MDIAGAEKAVGVTFKNKDLLIQAFTHRSYINEKKGHGGHNERLEFLGDAVLELVSTVFLYEEFPNKPEGDLTAYRAALVNTQTISEAATELGFNNFLLLSKGEAKDTGRARQYILANSFESVIGAIYLDQGYEAASIFIKKNLLPKIGKIIEEGSWIDGKSLFQEKSQETFSVTPQYRTLSAEGPDHNKEFTVAVYLNDEEIGRGTGKSKQEAEQESARNALKKKGWI